MTAQFPPQPARSKRRVWPWIFAAVLALLLVAAASNTAAFQAGWRSVIPASDGFTTLPAKVHGWGADIAAHVQAAAEKATGQ